MIELTGITQHYGVRPILRDVSLRVDSGALVAVMGPNGVGKSTLLGVMAGTLAPQRGHVEIDGLRRRSSPQTENEIRRRVAYLPDQPWLPPQSTGREFLLAVGRLYGIDDDRLFDHLERLVELFDLTRIVESQIRSCSNGQKKKIAVASALITEAPVLILDEPFSGGLDPSALLALKTVLRRLAERPDVTVVLATQVPELVEGLAHRVVVVHDGSVLAYEDLDGLRRLSGCDGSLGEVLERLINPHTSEHLDRYFEDRDR